MGLVDNTAVRHAVAAFAARPEQRTALEVLRQCMFGELLLDTTGSDAPQNGTFAAGSNLQINGGTGPDGGRALFAFTRQEEIARRYPPNVRTQSLVTSAVGAVELVRNQGSSWLYIDPAGPTCALAANEIDFALRNPRNERLKQALVAFGTGQLDRRGVVDALLQDEAMLIAADDRTVPGQIGVRTAVLPDGSPAMLGFTSGPEVLAYNPDDAVSPQTVGKVLDIMRRDGHHGLVIDPAGPWIALSRAEIDESLR